ncbi:Fur family transcriptional regulator [Chitinivibrio alkaliphilus]|uniref:Fur family ferric uptake regulator n=1 Tax=Chitinivibrio alkaliphilus ACht1 TaxID=1313304 RepID=U7D6F5_9BACT|nr:Fur family transcriptional regulator [Chitinivibrio alkaliphilus]ERP30672.1 Fur family ferric uptake regulator [Chitinivibrio alkaliphilus ACht1]
MTVAELLRAKNLRVTPQREAIAEILLTHGHLTVDSLYAFLTETHPSISLATVYKNIKDMVEKGFVMEVSLPNQKSLFEIHKESHVHTHCRCCGALTDIHYNPLELAGDIATLLGDSFSPDSAQLVFQGICNTCKNTQK